MREIVASTREEAVKIGVCKYFGNTCVKCGYNIKLVTNYSCVGCSKLRVYKRRKENPDYEREINRKLYHQNRQKFLDKMRRYQEENKEENT